MAKRVPPEDDVKLNVTIPRELLVRLKKRAIDRDLKLKEAVREAVAQWLKN